jgi:hypothetical protein
LEDETLLEKCCANLLELSSSLLRLRRDPSVGGVREQQLLLLLLLPLTLQEKGDGTAETERRVQEEEGERGNEELTGSGGTSPWTWRGGGVTTEAGAMQVGSTRYTIAKGLEDNNTIAVCCCCCAYTVL